MKELFDRINDQMKGIDFDDLTAAEKNIFRLAKTPSAYSLERIKNQLTSIDYDELTTAEKNILAIIQE